MIRTRARSVMPEMIPAARPSRLACDLTSLCPTEGCDGMMGAWGITRCAPLSDDG